MDDLIPPSLAHPSAPGHSLLGVCHPSQWVTTSRVNRRIHESMGTKEVDELQERLSGPWSVDHPLPARPNWPGRNSDSTEEDTLCDETGVDDLDHQSEMCSPRNGKQMQHALYWAYMGTGQSQARLRTWKDEIFLCVGNTEATRSPKSVPT